MTLEEKKAEEYYYKTYPVTINLGEEERKKEVLDIFIAGYKEALKVRINTTTISDAPLMEREQLAQATDIIKRVVDWAESEHPKEYFDWIIKDAKQFLKELAE